MDNSTMEDLGLFGSERIDGVGEEKDIQYTDVGASPIIDPTASPIMDPTASPIIDPTASPLGWNIAQLSPVGTDPFSTDPRTYVRNESNRVNAVHMHVQENARIPNYNHPVDRSNSSTSRTYPRSSYATDVLLSSKPERENSMAEIFLSSESRYRQSLNQTYEVVGSLTTEDSNIQKEIDELAAVSVDPTPWSEIQDQIHIEEEREKQQQVQQNRKQQEQLPVTTSAPVASIHPHQSSYYPYGRHHQLPIPEQPPPPPQISENNTAGQEVSRMAEAIATAAAIARSNSDAGNAADNAANILPAKESGLATMSVGESSSIPFMPTANETHQAGLPKVKAPKARLQPKTTRNYFAGNDKAAASGRHLQRGNATPTPHAAAHAVSRASLLAASNRKSQYGFGGNHLVPSVPAPPSIRSSNQPVLQMKTVRKNKQTAKKATPTPSIKPHIPVPKRTLAVPNGRHPTLHVENNTGSAYERKKQKAKDARVKLNEAIERLAVAVSLAGSQSKHRIDQLETQITTTEFRQKSIAVNQEGIKLAENAKKWDRPSFVGTAASVIQSLNAQCEALMAELLAIQKMLDASKANDGGKGTLEDATRDDTMQNAETAASSTDVSNTEVSKAVTEQGESPTSHKRYQQSADIMKETESPNKRPRLGSIGAQNLSRNDEVVLSSVARLLDPVSLCRCACTSKRWREMNAFKDEKIWLNLAVKRFGVYNVRKWSENLKDGECGQEISNKHLYEEMNASNVMPHFSQEGLSFIGNGKIQGKLSGWVFIVQRSNGETLRSVKRDPSQSGGVGYQSRPVVELRIVVQNTGMATQPVILKAQKVGVDVSTRRRGGEFEEIYWDDRFKKVVRNINGTIWTPSAKSSHYGAQEDLCELKLFETAVIEVHINARGCSTISKFRQRSNFTKILASLDGTTVPMVIPFLKHDSMF